MYQYPEIEKMSIAAIKKLNAAGIKCTVLTKGILPFELSSFSRDNEYGITLITLSEDFRKRIEPGSAPLDQRLAALKALHDAGCKTWVSIEPYPTPNILEQRLDELLEAVSFVDRIVFGRMNYSTEVNAYKRHKQFFNECAAEVEQFCADHGISCHIKEGTIRE
jgi:DNA repair photolyase